MACQHTRLALPAGEALRMDLDGDQRNGMEVQALIGANLRQLREGRGLSCERLARLADLDESTLQALERGATIPSIGMLWKLARELDVPCTAFIEARAPEATFEAQPNGSGFSAVG